MTQNRSLIVPQKFGRKLNTFNNKVSKIIEKQIDNEQYQKQSQKESIIDSINILNQFQKYSKNLKQVIHVTSSRSM